MSTNCILGNYQYYKIVHFLTYAARTSTFDLLESSAIYYTVYLSYSHVVLKTLVGHVVVAPSAL